MFNKNTVIVIGAGASKEVNLPTGNELKREISRLLDIKFSDGYTQSTGDYDICQALRIQVANQGHHDINPHLHACWRIRDAMPQAISIDNFIDAHEGDKKLELCGKLAIVRSILSAESNSLIFKNQKSDRSKINFAAAESTWFNSFLQLLTENCKVDQLESRLSQITLIIFNYDRCVEHYLFYALQNYYGINEESASALVKNIKIFHPYGTVGNLPWYSEDNRIGFGNQPDPRQLLNLASQIKTFSEGTVADSEELIGIKRCIENADIVLFLGFAYHKLNLSLLNEASREVSKSKEIYGTAYGISSNDTEYISEELCRTINTQNRLVHIKNDLTCSQLFQEYWRALSLSSI